MLAPNYEKTSIDFRNKMWNKNEYIPSWVNINDVKLDNYYTKPEIAEEYYSKFVSFLQNENVDIDSYKFIEPSAGNGSFFNLLPKDKRLGLDVLPLHNEIIMQDFLSWQPNNINEKYIFIGNPPFGYRAWLALAFMNHAAKFADYIGFILPMSFQSEGKGSSKHRVKGMQLMYSEQIPSNTFISLNNNEVKVNTLWQIWGKGDNNISVKKTCKQWVDIFTVDLRKERLCGQAKINNADFFLQRTFYTIPPNLVDCFSKVKYVCGYGIIIKKDKDKIINILEKTDWNKYSNLTTHNCRHISMYHIEKVLTDNGFVDV